MSELIFKLLFCQVFSTCQGNCYDSTQIFSSTCMSKPKCTQHHNFRCYNKQTCTGVCRATESFTQCSVTCGRGIKTLTATCVDQNTGK